MAKLLEQHPELGEVSVETGLGWIVKVDEPSGRNAKVEIRAEHLHKPVMSWCDTADAGLYDLVRRLCADGTRVAYRIVVKRKRGQPINVPFDEIDRADRIRDLEAVEAVAGVVAPAAAQGPAEPPGPATRPEPSQPDSGSQGPQSDPLVCGGPCGGKLNDGRPVRRVSGVLQHVECPGPATEGPPPPADARGNGGATANGNGRGPRMAEAKPWEFYNSDGSINPGSYAYGAAEGMVLLANDLLLARARAADNGPFKPPTEGQIRGLSRRLLRAADRAQATLRDDGHVARMASSHTRCRSAVRVALEVYPPPWAGSADELKQWEANLADHAGVLLRLTVELIEPDPGS